MQVGAYMSSLEGKWAGNKCCSKKCTNKKHPVFLNTWKDEVQTLHRVQVLVKDADLTEENFKLYMRCDCKGYWRMLQCQHVYALAHWYASTPLPFLPSLNHSPFHSITVQVRAPLAQSGLGLQGHKAQPQAR